MLKQLVIQVYVLIGLTLFSHELLRPFKMELCIEDHDLHHRLGKSGMNYGKQTRIFDRIFGTISRRVECQQK